MKIHRFFRLFLYFFILSLFFLVFIKNSHAENDLCSQLYCSAGTYCQCIGVIYGNGVDACTYGQSSDCDCSCNSSASSFLPGTLVKTTTGERKIEDIRVGDEVLSFKDEKIAYSKVVRIFKYPKPYHYTLEAGEYMVKVTYNHPFYIGSNQFKIVEDLKIGDTVYVLENGQLTAKEITQKTRVEEESYVYNLTVDNTNTYFANDFAVHNKWAPPNPMGGENCAPNYTPNYSQVTRTFCTSDYKDTDIVEGNARKITGCCDNTHEDEEGNEVCNHHNYQWTDYACVPIATPTPTPWIRVVVKNPTGTAVNSKQICGVDCSGSVCTKKGAAYCSANDNDFTFSKFNSVNNRLGGRIALADQLNRAFIVVGVTPSVSGFEEPTCNGINGYCYVWNENSWSTGGRTVDFIVASPTPTPTPYPTVAISGNLREYLGAACYNNISTNTLSLNINPQIPAGVTANCGVTPPTGQTKSSYRCTVVFNNTSDPSQNLNLAALATGYSSAYWTNANACTNTAGNSLPIDVSSGGSTVYNKDIFFKNVSSWIKLKNSSFSGSGSLTNVLPLSIAAYDSDDDISQRYFIMNSTGNDPGLVTASSINTGTADVSSKNWKADYTQSTVMNPTAFLSYVKSRKTYTKITALNQITSDGIYVWDEVTSFPGITTATTPNFNFVLISTTQAITISGTDFSPGKSVALVANSITFGNSTQTANGLFIAQTIDAGSNSNQGLKITGNLIAKTTLTNNRSWSNNSKPSVFIVFDPVQYINLLPYLSTANYDWRQIQ